MEIEKILSRININKSIETFIPNLETLTLLQESYILNVPYENLDFALNRDFSVKIFDIYNKIVEGNRGGICYESNTLFMYLLDTLGFQVQMIFAKVDDLTYIGADYPHLALIVTIKDKKYLVDVSNGQNVRVPMNINDDKNIAISEGKEYRISMENGIYFLSVNHKLKGWKTRYNFDLEKITVKDFEHVFKNNKNYEQFSNHAPLLVTQALSDGRITLTDDMMSLKSGKERKFWNISLENRAEVLRDYFNIII